MLEPTLTEAYGNVGALGIAFLVLMTLILAFGAKAAPALLKLTKAVNSLRSDYNAITQALNTVAGSVEEVAKSNVNVAHMVELLETTLKSQKEVLEKHDRDAAHKFGDAITIVRSNHEDILKAVEKNGENSQQQHKEITDQLIRNDDRGQRIETEVGKVKGHVDQLKILVTTKG